MSILTYNHFPKARHAKYAAALLSLPDMQSKNITHTSADVHQTQPVIIRAHTHTFLKCFYHRLHLAVRNPHHQLVIKDS